MNHTPTAEQAAIIDAYSTGDDLVIEAGAGSGKTSTLKMLAADQPYRRGLYVAYNKAIQVDADREFPRNIVCKTAHALAYAAVGRSYAHRLRGPRVPARVTAQILGVPMRNPLPSGFILPPNAVARITMDTVRRFCHSADRDITTWHVPHVTGVELPGDRTELAEIVVPLARKAWRDLTDRSGRLRFDHDCYLKIWQLSEPRLPADVVFLDEAQDANPAVAAIVEGHDGQRVMVGDACQAIYGWRGAQDAMAKFACDRRLSLSQSFRFGPRIAGEANKWLELLDAALRLTGFDRVDSTVGRVEAPDAVLCRTNAGAIGAVLAARNAGHRVALVGGGGEIRRMAEAAIKLKAGIGCDDPELFAFTSWKEVQDYVTQDAAGQDLKVFVKLIDEHGPERVIDIVDSLAPEDRADVVVSTAHKAKGREWSTVRIAGDFREPKPSEDNPDPRLQREEMMLAYVAVTRAKLVLDRDGLAWVDRWLGKAVPPC